MRAKFYNVAKRVADATLAALLLGLLLPLLVVVAILVRFNLGRPVFFVQLRPGLNGRSFRLIKFRTMKNKNSVNDGAAADALRLTRFGVWLRSTSIDEIPELWNILRGEMSFVGPRPLLIEYMPLYNKEQLRRHSVLPGLTGLAQINGRNSVSWPDRLALDVRYADHRSFWLDIEILAKTVFLVLNRAGVTEEGQATMSPFKGDSQ
jgi:sugar transferase EpsL